MSTDVHYEAMTEDERALYDFLTRKYVTSADDRQRAMGLNYLEAETHDLAREVTRFFASRPRPAVDGGVLNELRAQGWTVAVHNDYRLGGEPHTFWLLTHPSGRWIKGEGRTDDEALAQCLALLPPPLEEDAGRGVEELEAAILAAVDAAIRKFRVYTDAPNIEAVIIAARGAICDTFDALATRSPSPNTDAK